MSHHLTAKEARAYARDRCAGWIRNVIETGPTTLGRHIVADDASAEEFDQVTKDRIMNEIYAILERLER